MDNVFETPKTPKFYVLDAGQAHACADSCFGVSDDARTMDDLACAPLPAPVQALLLERAGAGQLSVCDIVTILARAQQPSHASNCNWMTLLSTVIGGACADTATALLSRHEEHVTGTWRHFCEYVHAADLLTAHASGTWHLAQPDTDALCSRIKAWTESRLREMLPEAEFAKIKTFMEAPEHGPELYKGTETPPAPRNPIADITEVSGGRSTSAGLTRSAKG